MAREPFQTLSEPMYYVLLALTKERFGVDVMNDVDRLSRGRVRVGPGTLYALLPRFEATGWIVCTKVYGRRKAYQLTKAGWDILKKEYRRLRQMEADARPIMEEWL
ncbi:MAG: PadR family transcriptional regulator [Acutalibacteraceae bacterium]|jgi:DNA-binding PadR family transcriptional regulator